MLVDNNIFDIFCCAYLLFLTSAFRWKMKVKQLERELDRHKHGNQQMMQRNEQLVKEMEAIRQQGHTYGIQLENMRRELGDALVCNH